MNLLSENGGLLPASTQQAPTSKAPSPDLPELIEAGHPQRAPVEAFIARRFLEVHGARITEFMPQLLALFDDQGEVRAAVGMRDAGQHRLFLEYYLDNPVESLIQQRTGVAAEREQVVEIGNLASIDRRASRKLFRVLAQRLHAEHFEWAVFTGCGSLHRMFATIGIETVGLGRALQSRLPVELQTWGGYYEDNPQVVAGRVGLGRRVFEKLAVAA